MTTESQQHPNPNTQALLDSLPGLVGGIDHHILKHSKERQPFMLLVFSEGAVLHATNADPAVARALTQAYVLTLNAHQVADGAADNGSDDKPVAE